MLDDPPEDEEVDEDPVLDAPEPELPEPVEADDEDVPLAAGVLLLGVAVEEPDERESVR